MTLQIWCARGSWQVLTEKKLIFPIGEAWPWSRDPRWEFGTPPISWRAEDGQFRFDRCGSRQVLAEEDKLPCQGRGWITWRDPFCKQLLLRAWSEIVFYVDIYKLQYGNKTANINVKTFLFKTWCYTDKTAQIIFVKTLDRSLWLLLQTLPDPILKCLDSLINTNVYSVIGSADRRDRVPNI